MRRLNISILSLLYSYKRTVNSRRELKIAGHTGTKGILKTNETIINHTNRINHKNHSSDNWHADDVSIRIVFNKYNFFSSWQNQKIIW
jgi:hypothetical protein